MRRLAILAIVAAFALPCAASDPNRPDPRVNVMMAPKLRSPNTPPPAPPEPPVIARLVRTVLFPDRLAAEWVLSRIPHTMQWRFRRLREMSDERERLSGGPWLMEGRVTVIHD
jgi:hypothetical protein